MPAPSPNVWEFGMPPQAGPEYRRRQPFADDLWGRSAALADAAERGDIQSAGQAAVRRATGAQQGGALSLGETMGGRAAERGATQAVGTIGQAGVQQGRIVGEQDELMRQALLVQLARQALAQRMGVEDLARGGRLADLGVTTERALGDQAFWAPVIGAGAADLAGAIGRQPWGGGGGPPAYGGSPGGASSGMGPVYSGSDGWYATDPNSDRRAKQASDAPVSIRPEDTVGVVLALLGRLDDRLRRVEGR